MIADRSFEYWTPEPLFAGETMVCIASGPSLTPETCRAIAQARDAGRCRAIAVNSSCRMAPWADVLFFTDSGWYEANREAVRGWPGLVTSMSRRAKAELPDKVKRVKGHGQPVPAPRRFPPVGSAEIQYGRSSGHTAVGVAAAVGATRILLAGYDMRVVDGREHFHRGETIYQGPRDLGLYANEFVPGFAGWNAAALASGVEIINCTPGSAVTEFPFADLGEALALSGPSSAQPERMTDVDLVDS